MTRGSGSLVWASREGVRVSGLVASPVAGAPAPTTWAHNVGCGWVAAWLTVRGRQLRGSRELLADDGWRGELAWARKRDGQTQRSGHRPDLVTWRPEDEHWRPVEIELAAKGPDRLDAVLALYRDWISAGKITSLMYVCGTERMRARVTARGQAVGLSTDGGRLGVVLVDEVRAAIARTPATV